MTLPPIVPELVRLAGEAAQSQACSLYLLNGNPDVLEPAVVIGLPESYVQGIGQVRVGTQCCGRAVSERRPWIVEDMFTDPLFAEGCSGAQAGGIRAAFSVPVVAPDGSVLGSLACHYQEPRAPRAYDIERNQIFARLIGFALREQPPLAA